MISPSCMLTSRTRSPSGVKLSWKLFTAPVDASVVAVAQRPDRIGPKRTSLPSMLPPGEEPSETWLIAERREGRVADLFCRHRDGNTEDEDKVHRARDGDPLLVPANYAAAHPGEAERDRQDDDRFDQVGQRAGILERMRRIGVDEAAPVGAKSSMTSWLATGPRAIVCVVPSSVLTVTLPPSVCGTPCATSTRPTMIETGSRMYSVERVSPPRSCRFLHRLTGKSAHHRESRWRWPQPLT